MSPLLLDALDAAASVIGVGVTAASAAARASARAMWQNGRSGSRTEKTPSKPSAEVDFATKVDFAAEQAFLDAAQDDIDLGRLAVISEERGVVGDPMSRVIVTLDPICGTKAVFRQRGGLERTAVMAGVLLDGVPVGGYVQGLDSGEGGAGFYASPMRSRPRTSEAIPACFYRYGHARPNSASEPGPRLPLRPDHGKLSSAYCVYSGFEHLDLPPWGRATLCATKHGGAFKGIESGRGSVGVHMGRLWIGEVGAVVTEPGVLTPWDETPIQALHDRLGIVTVTVSEAGEIEEFRYRLPFPIAQPVGKPTMPHWRISVHRSRLDELREAIARRA